MVVKETFHNMIASSMQYDPSINQSKKTFEFIVSLIVLFVWICLLLFLGKFLWNDVLCSMVTICKKADSIWQILGVSILFSLINL